MPTDTLEHLLRFALRHLYDSDTLRTSPLIGRLGLAEAANPGAQLRQVLTRAVRSLQPEQGMPAHSEVWRAYEVLLYRYVQRCSQLEVADQLGISDRQLRREEQRAFQALAERLSQKPVEPAAPSASTAEPASASRPDAAPETADLAWLENSPGVEPVELGQALSSAVELIGPLVRQHGARVRLSGGEGASPLAVHPVALRQLLLSLLGAAIRQAPGQEVVVSTRWQDKQAEVTVRAGRSTGEMHAATGDEPSLAMARRLCEACGGRLSLEEGAGCFAAILFLPALDQVPVLLIDDNVSLWRLLQRYVSNTRYRIVPAANVEDGLQLARDIAPRIIVLDVMMPDVDGWEVLGRLREHPLTRHVPVIICTILAEEELAYSLGATGYVRKPVTRQALLQALDELQ